VRVRVSRIVCVCVCVCVCVWMLSRDGYTIDNSMCKNIRPTYSSSSSNTSTGPPLDRPTADEGSSLNLTVLACENAPCHVTAPRSSSLPPHSNDGKARDGPIALVALERPSGNACSSTTVSPVCHAGAQDVSMSGCVRACGARCGVFGSGSQLAQAHHRHRRTWKEESAAHTWMMHARVHHRPQKEASAAWCTCMQAWA
jgi:hypothetical protein